MQPVRFHFDFVSPYSYVAWTQVHALGERIGRAIEPVPFFLGGVPKAVGSPAPAFNPPKARYILKDCARKARVGGVPFEPPAAVDDRARSTSAAPASLVGDAEGDVAKARVRARTDAAVAAETVYFRSPHPLGRGTGRVMLDATLIRRRIEAAIADAEAHVVDTTGTGDHFAARVIADAFAGRSPVDRHRMVYAPLHDLLATGELHALALETYTPDQWAQVGAELSE